MKCQFWCHFDEFTANGPPKTAWHAVTEDEVCSDKIRNKNKNEDNHLQYKDLKFGSPMQNQYSSLTLIYKAGTMRKLRCNRHYYINISKLNLEEEKDGYV